MIDAKAIISIIGEPTKLIKTERPKLIGCGAVLEWMSDLEAVGFLIVATAMQEKRSDLELPIIQVLLEKYADKDVADSFAFSLGVYDKTRVITRSGIVIPDLDIDEVGEISKSLGYKREWCFLKEPYQSIWLKALTSKVQRPKATQEQLVGEVLNYLLTNDKGPEFVGKFQSADHLPRDRDYPLNYFWVNTKTGDVTASINTPMLRRIIVSQASKYDVGVLDDAVDAVVARVMPIIAKSAAVAVNFWVSKAMR